MQQKNTTIQAPLTIGQQYASTYLKDETRLDEEWIAMQIDGGHLVVCPRCHFLRFPNYPFDWSTVVNGEGETPPEGVCDVCASVKYAVNMLGIPHSMTAILDGAPADLTEQRTRRARALNEFCLSAGYGAESLLWSAMAASVEQLRQATAQAEREAFPAPE